MKKFLLLLTLALNLAIVNAVQAIHPDQPLTTYSRKGEWTTKTTYGNEDPSTYIYQKDTTLYDSLVATRAQLEMPASTWGRDEPDVPSTNAISTIISQCLTKKEKTLFTNNENYRNFAFCRIVVDKKCNRICEVSFWFPFTDAPHQLLSQQSIKKLHKRLMGLTVYGERKTPSEYFYADIHFNEQMAHGLPEPEDRLIFFDFY
jgi:hypothetical protein